MGCSTRSQCIKRNVRPRDEIVGTASLSAAWVTSRSFLPSIWRILPVFTRRNYSPTPHGRLFLRPSLSTNPRYPITGCRLLLRRAEAQHLICFEVFYVFILENFEMRRCIGKRAKSRARIIKRVLKKVHGRRVLLRISTCHLTSDIALPKHKHFLDIVVPQHGAFLLFILVVTVLQLYS
jgi:hypothetical protein